MSGREQKKKGEINLLNKEKGEKYYSNRLTAKSVHMMRRKQFIVQTKPYTIRLH